MMPSVLLTPLARMPTPRGDVLHAMKATDPGFAGFGEAYVSIVLPGAVKGWNRHRRMVLNLVVLAGCVRFHLRDDRAAASFTLSPDSPEQFARLTVPPGLWLAFVGTAPCPSLVLNLASIAHDPKEADRLPLGTFALPP